MILIFLELRLVVLSGRKKYFKPYKNVTKVSKLNLLQVSSIEIIARRDFVQKNQLRFNENIGLGTSYQGGEEIHFLLDAWEHSGQFKFLDKTFVRHTCIFEERVLATNNIFLIRGATASRFGLVGLALLARWSWRYFKQYKNIHYVFNMFRGFLRGYKFFK